MIVIKPSIPKILSLCGIVIVTDIYVYINILIYTYTHTFRLLTKSSKFIGSSAGFISRLSHSFSSGYDLPDLNKVRGLRISSIYVIGEEIHFPANVSLRSQ